MIDFSDSLKQRGKPSVAELKEELEQLCRAGLWRETAHGYLRDRGFVQAGNESLAQTMAGALGITTHELRNCIADGRIGSAPRNVP